MDAPKEFAEVLNENNFVLEGYGYKKVTKENTHWITFFENGLQMYGFNTYENKFFDPSCEKVYDTGIIKIIPGRLQILISIFTSNHN